MTSLHRAMATVLPDSLTDTHQYIATEIHLSVVGGPHELGPTQKCYFPVYFTEPAQTTP